MNAISFDAELSKRAALAANAANATPEESGVSDDELAQRFSERHAGTLRYVAAWGAWLLWDGACWRRDEVCRVWDFARKLCRDVRDEKLRSVASESQERALRVRLGSASTVANVIRLAQSDPRHAVAVDALDADPWALNTPGGVVDLRSGELRLHDSALLHTKITRAAPGGDCPTFRAFLERVLPDPELRAYVQRLAGYGLTGSAREHVLPFAYGTGRNGKGTLLHTLRDVMGDYAIEIASETLMESHHDRHPTELAALRGARLVVASEVDSGRRWNESRLKRLTGGDPIAARYMGKDMFEFQPTHTLVIVGNHKPGLRAVDEAIRARIHLIPFAVTIPEAERDPTLPERLRDEAGGILAWAVEGCREWLRVGGLAAPATVRAATDEYLAGEDSLRGWLDECTRRSGQLTLKAAHKSYRDWCEQNSQAALGRNTFKDQLVDRGFVASRTVTNAVAIEPLELVQSGCAWDASEVAF